MTKPPSHHLWFRTVLVVCLAVALGLSIHLVVGEWSLLRTWLGAHVVDPSGWGTP